MVPVHHSQTSSMNNHHIISVLIMHQYWTAEQMLCFHWHIHASEQYLHNKVVFIGAFLGNQIPPKCWLRFPHNFCISVHWHINISLSSSVLWLTKLHIFWCQKIRKFSDPQCWRGTHASHCSGDHQSLDWPPNSWTLSPRNYFLHMALGHLIMVIKDMYINKITYFTRESVHKAYFYACRSSVCVYESLIYA